jgi:hypothetical protein
MNKRPHQWPCVCQECCVPWDPNSDWSGEPALLASKGKIAPVDQGMPLAEFCKRITEIACKATGLTEEQLRRKAAEMGALWPQREVMVERATRRHWSERDDGEDAA